MKVIIAHNYYQQPGGEDQVFSSEANLLEYHGHTVIRYTMDNRLINNMDPFKLALTTLWSSRASTSLNYLIRRHKPDVIHFHNTFPLISPACYYSKQKYGAAVVQTLHNFRMLCPGAFFIRKGKVCEKCLHKVFPWPGAIHACYRNSHITSGVTVGMLTLHKILGTWQKKIDCFIALSKFAKNKFIKGGIPPNKIVSKPNFIPQDFGTRKDYGIYGLFIGRLSKEKGILTILQALRKIRGIPIKILGDGPLIDEVRRIKIRERLKDVEILGFCKRKDVIRILKMGRFLIFSSEWYEGFPMTIAEAFSCGVPVVSSRVGSLTEIVEDGVTGLFFEPGNYDDLADKIQWLYNNQNACHRMGENARKVFLEKYTAEKNYKLLMNIYERALNPV